jgi:outer membrane protein assembly factor BamB
LIKEGGMLTSIDPLTGEVFKRGRLPGASDQFFASPVAGEGKLYLSSQAGHVVVVNANPQWDVLAVNDVEDDCYATPALADGRLCVRTWSALYCFGLVGSRKPE